MSFVSVQVETWSTYVFVSWAKARSECECG